MAKRASKKAAASSELVRVSFRMSESDRANLDTIKRALGMSRDADACRFALRAFAARLDGLSSKAPSTAGELASAGGLFVTRLTPADRKAAANIKRHYGFDSVSQAVRYAIHREAQAL